MSHHVAKQRDNPDEVFRDLLASIKPPPPPGESPSHESLNTVDSKNESLLQQIDLLIELQEESRWPASGILLKPKDTTEQLSPDDSGVCSLGSDSSHTSFVSNDAPLTPNLLSENDSSTFNFLDQHRSAAPLASHDYDIPMPCTQLMAESHDGRSFETIQDSSTVDATKASMLSPGKCLFDDANNSNNKEKGVENSYSEHELSAIRKFLQLTSKYFDNFPLSFDDGGIVTSPECVDPATRRVAGELKKVIQGQQAELDEHRTKMEHFNGQLQQLFTKVQVMKEQQSDTHIQHTKALQLLTLQLQQHKTDLENTSRNALDNVETALNRTTCPSPNVTTNCLCAFLSEMRVGEHSHGYTIWTINDIMKKIGRSKSTKVPDEAPLRKTFSTGEYGYFVEVSLYLNGHGTSLGRSVAVHANIACGEYDPILQWPVNLCFKFTLLDQETDTSKRADHTRMCTTTVAHERGGTIRDCEVAVGRPTRDDPSSVCVFGIEDFIEHIDLIQHRYVVDDVAFLRVDAFVDQVSQDAYHRKRIY